MPLAVARRMMSLPSIVVDVVVRDECDVDFTLLRLADALICGVKVKKEKDLKSCIFATLHSHSV